LFDKRINYRVFITQPDYFSGVKKPSDFIEPYYGVYLPGKPLFLFNPLYAYDPGNIPAYFENQDFISFSANKYYKKYHYFWYFWIYPPVGIVTLPITLPIFWAVKSKAKKHRKFDFDEGSFPSTKPENNSIVYDIKIKNMDMSANAVQFERKTSYYGKLKLSETHKICAASYLYENAENPYSKMLSGTTKKMVKDKVEIERMEKYLNSLIKANLSDDGFEIKKLNSFQVSEANFFDKSKPFVHASNFTADELVWNYNNYIILNAGHLIGEQLIVPEKSKDRQQDFYIPYPKQFSWSISIPLPEGYSVENLADFNVKKTTSAGGFVSEAKVEGNNVVVNTKKSYFFN
ncbi:MAG TPA: hypothetical protein VNX68_08295, partial [Nitrosopumilaceae archaeon]|nr:hypothetical protein [Nitrosopumilaceae archaeon]